MKIEDTRPSHTPGYFTEQQSHIFVLPFVDYIMVYMMHPSFEEANILKDYTYSIHKLQLS